MKMFKKDNQLFAKASIFVLVWKLSSRILLRILELLKPGIFILVSSRPWSFVLKSAVKCFLHVGHDACLALAEKSIKQDRQKECPHALTWSDYHAYALIIGGRVLLKKQKRNNQ